MNKFFVLIINFNNQKSTSDCLKVLRKIYPKIKVIVIDNASTDDSLLEIKSLKDPFLKIIENRQNLGFAKAVNIGLKLALKQGLEAVLLLNPDTLPVKGFLEPLSAHPAEIVGPILKFKRTGNWVYDFGGKINFWLGRTFHQEYSSPSFKQAKSPDYLSGACLLIKKKAFKKIGFLNEKYFLFFEDADFCLRAKKAGLKIALESKSIMIHNLSEGKKKPFYYFYHLLRSNFIFINTWLPLYRRPVAYFYLWLLGLKILLNRL